MSQYVWSTLRWHRNGRDRVSNHQPHDCLLNRLFRGRTKETSKLRVTGLCVGNSPGTGEFPHKWPVTRKMSQFDDVIMKLEEYGKKVPATIQTKIHATRPWLVGEYVLRLIISGIKVRCIHIRMHLCRKGWIMRQLSLMLYVHRTYLAWWQTLTYGMLTTFECVEMLSKKKEIT